MESHLRLRRAGEFDRERPSALGAIEDPGAYTYDTVMVEDGSREGR